MAAKSGEALKQEILLRLEMSNADALKVIRERLAALYCFRVAKDPHGSGVFVTADDARRIYDGLESRPHKTAFLGAVFKSAEWKWAGQMVKSLRTGRHAGLLYTWRLKDG